jgi:hypothetical protein
LLISTVAACINRRGVSKSNCGAGGARRTGVRIGGVPAVSAELTAMTTAPDGTVWLADRVTRPTGVSAVRCRRQVDEVGQTRLDQIGRERLRPAFLYIEAIDDVFSRVRRIDAAAIVSTVAGGHLSCHAAASRGRVPTANSPPRALPLSARSATFAAGPANSLYVVSGPSVLRVNGAGDASPVIGTNHQNAPQVPDPKAGKPVGQHRSTS